MSEIKLDKPKKLRQKLLILYHEDGLLDMVTGVTVLLLALVFLTNPVFIGLIGIPLVLYIPLKDRVSTPRLGIIHFEPETDTRKRLVVFMLLGMGTFIVFFLFYRLATDLSPVIRGWLNANEIMIFVILLSGTLFTAGHALNNPRFWIYALISFVLVLAASLLGMRTWGAIGVTGLMMEVVGSYKLFHFLRAYPHENGE